MTAKEYLNTYRDLVAIEREKHNSYKLAEDKISSIPTIFNLPDGIKTNSRSDHSRTEDVAIELSERREAWMIAALNALEARQDIFDMICDVPGSMGDILIERYIDLKKWDDICVSVGNSWYGVHNLHRRGLEIVQEMIDANNAEKTTS